MSKHKSKVHDNYEHVTPCVACGKGITAQKKNPIFKPRDLYKNGNDHIEGFPYDEQEDLCTSCKSKIRIAYSGSSYTKDYPEYQIEYTTTVDDSEINETTYADLQYDGFID